MRSLTRFLLPAIACALAAPASAQFVGKRDYEDVGPANPFIGDSSLPGPGIGRELRHIRDRIDDARASGVLSRREARALYRESRALAGLSRRYGRDGMSPSERRELEARAAYLRDAAGR